MAFFLCARLYLRLAFFAFSSLCDLFGWRRCCRRRRRTAITNHSASMTAMADWSRIQKKETACVDINMRIFAVTRPSKQKNRESIYRAKYLNRQKKWDINRISITVFVRYTSTGCVLHFALPCAFFFSCIQFLFSFHNMHMVNKNVWICEYKRHLRMKKKKRAQAKWWIFAFMCWKWD